MIRTHRLAGRERFAALRSDGTSARGVWVSVRAIRRDGEVSCAAIAVRGSKSAVERNRARRRLRAALAPILLRHQGYDLLIAAVVSDAARSGFEELSADLEATVDSAVGRAA